jgi:16S rRNA G966 N2-methylase RsmD
MKVVEKQIKELIEAEYNPRRLTEVQYRQLKDSLLRFGVVDPVLVNKNAERKNIIIGGHQRTKVWQDLGNDTIPCVELDLTLDQEKELNIRLNKNTGEFDFDMLANYFDEGQLLDFGFNPEEIDFFTDELEGEGTAEEDDYEEPDEVQTNIVQGDLITFEKDGEELHRLLCGDSTKKEDVERLMNGKKADLIHTDPPYGMNAVSKSNVLKERYKTDILGDDDPEVAKKSFLNISNLYPNTPAVWWGANYYSSCLPDSECWLVWDKNNGGSDQTDCELAWANFRSVVRQFTKASEKTNRIHPTQKPVELVAWVVEKSKIDSITSIADFFGGSGVTMVYSHQKGLKSYLMEFDPKFCERIKQRMKALDSDLVIKINGKEYE